MSMFVQDGGETAFVDLVYVSVCTAASTYTCVQI